ncbi:nucleolar protein dao-5 isoform X7 [Anopheles funestus]|uniref:nucleolar protein dao-5 isoform X7 n=1 Tax=Anopheles funestus TaxID=62324 RepID=UPI0020C6034F|nr:nucleolar protein dao-5 isoform X7 [Anopheles funestus]
MSKYAWVTLATNDSYSLGALVVAHSLKRVHTVHQMAVLITPGVSEAMKTKLRAVFNVVEEVNLLDSKDAANLALLKRPELGVTFTKLHCWRLTQFEKCVFLDADTLVLRNSDELFEREELSAAPDIGWPDCFNSGVYVFRPNLETFSSLLQFAVTHGSFDGGDQGLLNAYFSEWAHKDIQKHLPFIYNTSSVATYSYLPAFKQFGQNTKILHFIGAVKPWLQNFNSETRKVYVPSEYQHLANFLQYWWDIFAEDVHSRLSPDMSEHISIWKESILLNAESGLAGALAQLHLGEAKSKEQEAYEEHMRRQCWETGNIDYMGRDSFENIWKRIQQTLSAGAGTSAEEKVLESSVAEPVSPAATQRTSRRPSRSRSATPKRDPKDRSPTPQPEDKKPVDKKEVQVVPPPVIAEEDDVAISLSSIESALAMRTQAKLPPPIQYDPTTNTTTLTKKVFAGYRQIITTKSPEGKTRTHEKLVYDPSIEDDQKPDSADDRPSTAQATSQVDVKQNVGAETATPQIVREEAKELSQKQSATPTVGGGTSETAPSKTERPTQSSAPAASSSASAAQPTIPKSSPKPVATPTVQASQQQVVQESIAGKTNALLDAKQPVKALRKKRHISPQSRPLQQTTTNAGSTDQAPGKPSPSSSSSLTSASRHDLPSNQKASIATAISSAVVSPSPSVSSSLAKTSYSPITPNTFTSLDDEKVVPIHTPQSPDKTLPTVQPSLKLNTQSAQTKPSQPVEGVKVGSPPVPPRRKRESRATKLEKTKKSKLVQLFLSCISCSKKQR